MLGEQGRLAEPPRRQHAQEVTVRDHCDISAERAHLFDDAVRARGHLGERLPVGHAVIPQVPTRLPLVDLGCGQPFVIAVVPLAEVGVEPRVAGQAGQLAGEPSADERAAEHRVE